MLPYLRVVRVLHFTSPGRLLPWMGPALRGLVARPFKEHVCLHPPAERDRVWVYCRGRPRMAECPYGLTFEPDPPPGAPTFAGQDQAARPLVLALPFPMPAAVRAGDRAEVSLTLLGRQSLDQEGAIWEAVERAGSRPGFDPGRTTFRLNGDDWREGPMPVELPPTPEGPSVGAVRVELTGPLFLRRRDEAGRRRHVAEPTFDDLTRAALRTLGALFALYDDPLAADFRGLKEAAQRVPLLRSDYASFHQDHRSNRSGERGLHGVVGSGVYGPVPGPLVEWLRWAGRAHVGGERVAGAGGWRLTELG